MPSNEKRASVVDWIAAGVRKSDGSVNANGKVKFFEPGTSVAKRVWQTRQKQAGTEWSPEGVVSLDANGRATNVYADGVYKVEVHDSSGANLQYTLAEAQYGLELVNVLDFGVQTKPATWGAMTDTQKRAFADANTAALQEAIDYALKYQSATPRSMPRIYIPAGCYPYTPPLRILQLINGNTEFNFIGLEIYGDKRTYPTAAAQGGIDEQQTVLEAYDNPVSPGTANQQAGIVIQGALNVSIRRLMIRGANNWTASSIDLDADIGRLIDGDSQFIVNGCRDNRYSPHAAIVVDPYAVTVGSSDQYPNSTVYYGVGAGFNRKSSGIEIDDCGIANWVVGIAISTSGQEGQGENITIKETGFLSNRICVAVGQSQAKNVVIENCHAYGQLFFLDNALYGAQTGACPFVKGGNIGAAKYLFHVNTTWQGFLVSGLYVESSLSIGYIGLGAATGHNPATLIDCTFNFWNTTDHPSFTVRRAIDFHLWSFGNVRFIGCSFASDTPSSRPQPIVFFDHDAVGLTSCSILDGDAAMGTFGGAMMLGFHDWEAPDIDDLWLRDNSLTSGVQILRAVHRAAAETDLHRRNLAPGSFVLSSVSNIRGLRAVEQAVREFAIGTSAAVLSTSGLGAGYATFDTSTFGGNTSLLKVGDLVYVSATQGTLFYPEGYPANATNASRGSIGIISAIAGSVVTIKYVPKSLTVNGVASYWLSVRYLGRYHDPTTGRVTITSSTISNVTPNPITSWSATYKDRIWGPGIPAGAYVTAVTSTTITMSVAATASTSFASLSDSVLALESPSFRPSKTFGQPDEGSIAEFHRSNLVLAWAHVTFSGGAPVLNTPHYNIASVVDNGVGHTHLTLDITLNTQHAVLGAITTHSTTPGHIEAQMFDASTIHVQTTTSANAAVDAAFAVAVIGEK